MPLLLLAGCTGGTELDSDPGNAPDVGIPATPDVLNSTLPLLGPAVDLWGEATERILFEGIVAVGECYGWDGQASVTAGQLLDGQQATFGCAHFELPEGTLVPEGTKSIRFEADASGAQYAGKWYAVVVTYGMIRYGDGHMDGEGTTGATHTWRFELKPKDWDLAQHAASHYVFGYWTYGDAADVLYGPVKTKIVAERDPKWEPVAPLDHFQLPDQHKFVGEGVFNSLDTNITWREPAETEVGAKWPDSPRVKDVIPLGTKQVSVVLQWGRIEGCPTTFECWTSAVIQSGNRWAKNQIEAQVRPDGGWKVYVYDVPDMVAEDGPYVKESMAQIHPFFYQCDPAVCITDTAGAAWPVAYLQPRQTELRVVVDVWHGDVDVAALKARLGLG